MGRRHELSEVRRLFEKASLVTLTGPGGVGKTRLATRAASGLAKAFPSGVCFVALAVVADPDLVTQTVADALGNREPNGASDLDSLIAYLTDRRLLLVLDNCEHLVDRVAVVVDLLRRSCPGLRILATSREPVAVEGEAILQLRPLPVPGFDEPHTAAGLPRFDAITLFVDRASAVMPDFALDEHNQNAVARVVAQLDGVPLALELAAARLRTLSPSELADRLTDRYRLLTGGNRVGPERHQTLRLCVDWSYSLCTDREQTLWCRLSIFTGTFTLDGIEGICAYGDLDLAEMVGLVGALVDKSVLSRTTVDGTNRFRLLESLRDYGLERLHEYGVYDELRAHHLDWYAELARRACDDWVSSRQIDWAERLSHELANLRAAFETALVEPADSVVALSLADSLHTFWLSRGMITEGRRLARRALAHHTGPPCLERVKALFSAVALAGVQGDHAEAGVLVEESGQIDSALRSELSAAITAHTVGCFGVLGGSDPDEAVESLAAAVDGFRTLGEDLRLASALVQLALGAWFAGQLARAKNCLEELLELTVPRGEVMAQAYGHWIGGLVSWQEGDLNLAVDRERQALRLRALMHDTIGSAWCLEALAFIAVSAGEPERAARLFGAASTLARDVATQSATFAALVPTYESCEATARQALGEDAFQVWHARGQALDRDDAIAFALRDPRGRSAPAVKSDSPLTRRETEVASLVAEGLTNKVIAERLVISPRTAQGHVENILTKLGYTSRAQVAAWVVGNDPTD